MSCSLRITSTLASTSASELQKYRRGFLMAMLSCRITTAELNLRSQALGPGIFDSLRDPGSGRTLLVDEFRGV